MSVKNILQNANKNELISIKHFVVTHSSEMLYYSAVQLKVMLSLFGGKYRHFFVAYMPCLSSFQLIMCREVSKLNMNIGSEPCHLIIIQ